MKLKFNLNGENVEIDTAPDRRVIDLLREDMGLTAAKEGCGSGECGACTIILNGDAVLSCLLPAVRLADSEVMTAEGLKNSETGRRLVEMFVEKGAVQCGFCTTGMEMSALALLMKKPNATRDEIKKALSGNLCRCTGYSMITDAVECCTERKK